MQTTSNHIKLRDAVLAVALPVGVSVLVGRWLWSVLTSATALLRQGAPIGVDEALLATAAALALATLVWLAIGVVLETAARVPGQVGRAAAHASAAVSPLVVRRAAAVVLGASLSAALSPGPSIAATGSAMAASIGVTASPTLGASAPGSTEPGEGAPDPGFAPLPDPGFGPLRTPGSRPLRAPGAEPSTAPERGGSSDPRATSPAGGDRFVAEPPLVRPQPDVSAVANADRRAPAPASREVVVHRGDSLWSIAARHLGPEPSEAEIATEWPRWYAANADVIGPDPDRLLPGQVLLAPHGSRP